MTAPQKDSKSKFKASTCLNLIHLFQGLIPLKTRHLNNKKNTAVVHSAGSNKISTGLLKNKKMPASKTLADSIKHLKKASNLDKVCHKSVKRRAPFPIKKSGLN